MGALSLDHTCDLFVLDPRSAARAAALEALRHAFGSAGLSLQVRRLTAG
jgi:hypothetical protein